MPAIFVELPVGPVGFPYRCSMPRRNCHNSQQRAALIHPHYTPFTRDNACSFVTIGRTEPSATQDLFDIIVLARDGDYGRIVRTTEAVAASSAQVSKKDL